MLQPLRKARSIKSDRENVEMKTDRRTRKEPRLNESSAWKCGIVFCWYSPRKI
jgi:hypothetical protein